MKPLNLIDSPIINFIFLANLKIVSQHNSFSFIISGMIYAHCDPLGQFTTNFIFTCQKEEIEEKP